MAHPISGEQFLHERNNDFQKSPEVSAVVNYLQQGGEAIPNAPDARIAAYLGFLGAKEYVNDGILTGDPESIRRQIEMSAVHLTKENAEAYVKFQAKVARELGRGAEVEPSKIDDEMKMNALRLVRKDQQLQLEEWVGELNSAENNYPDWFKHWVFEQVKRTTAYNEELGKNGKAKGFERRSAGSFALFPELDRASLSLVHDALQEKLTGVKMEAGYDVDYGPLRALLGEANFGKLYGEAQNYGFKITDELKEITTGSWHDFAQSDYAEDADALSALVRSYRTGWCTAGRETAGKQLETGDFYVWCSTNPETGEDEVPRIAVRMEQGRVAEVRGIVGGKRQELEPALVDTVMEKIKDLPGGQEYFEKAENMRRITDIDNRIGAGGELTSEDILFLRFTGVYGTIKGFGYGDDPRTQELLKGRDLNEDIKEILASGIIDPTSFAERMLFTYGATNVIDRINLFSAHDVDWTAFVRNSKMVGGDLRTAARHFDDLIEAGVDKHVLVDKIGGYADLLTISNISKILNVDDADDTMRIVKKLFRHGAGVLVAENPEVFIVAGGQPNAIMSMAIDYGCGSLIISNLDKLVAAGASPAGAVRRLVQEYDGRAIPSVISNLDAFIAAGVDSTRIASIVIHAALKKWHKPGLAAKYLSDLFTAGADPSVIARQFIENHEYSLVRANLKEFVAAGLSREIQDEIIRDEQSRRSIY